MILTADRKVISRSDEYETREYTINGSPDQLDEFEALLDWVSKLCSWGHSASAKISVDGDGAANLKIEGHKANMEEHEGYDESGSPELSIGLG